MKDPLEALIEELRAEYEGQEAPRAPPRTPPPVPRSDLLGSLKAAYEALDRQEEGEASRARARAEEVERRRREELARRQREIRAREAQAFLAALAPRSEEARWFQKFSAHYPNDLEAAIAYLDALDEAEGP